MTEYYFVGKIINTHGLKGEVKVKAETDFPQQRFCSNSNLYISVGDQKVKMTVETVRFHKQAYLVKFLQINDIDEANRIVNKNLYVSDEDQTDLPKGSYYIHQLIGLDVFDYETKTKIGILTDIEMPGANDIWEITPSKGKIFWIPNISSVVKQVDLVNKKIEVILLEGLRDEN